MSSVCYHDSHVSPIREGSIYQRSERCDKLHVRRFPRPRAIGDTTSSRAFQLKSSQAHSRFWVGYSHDLLPVSQMIQVAFAQFNFLRKGGFQKPNETPSPVGQCLGSYRELRPRREWQPLREAPGFNPVPTSWLSVASLPLRQNPGSLRHESAVAAGLRNIKLNMF